MSLPFTKEAENVIDAYLKALDEKLNVLGFHIDDEQRRDFLLAAKHSLKLSSIRYAKRKMAKFVEEWAAKKAVRHVSPTRLIRHGLQSPKIFSHVEKLKKKHFEMLREKIEASDKPRVLDAGCQYGRQSMEYLRRGLKSDFFGVDIDIEAIRYGKSVEPSIEFVAADIQQNLPFKDDTFDVVTCIGVLHLAAKGVDKAIQEFARVLKPNGILFFAQALTKNKLASSMAYFLWKLVPKIGRLYHKNRIETILMQNGFTRIVMDKTFSIPLILGDVYICTAFLDRKLA